MKLQMDNTTLWNIIIYTGGAIAAPLLGMIGYKYKQIEARFKSLEDADKTHDKRLDIFDVKLDGVHQDIKEIKNGIQNILDKLLNIKANREENE